MTVKRDQMYLFPTWLAKMMAGETTCEWATWFRVHHRDWQRPPSDFDQAKYVLEHTRAVRELRSEMEGPGTRLYVERQAQFWFTHPSGVRMSGNPDLISVSDTGNVVHEVRSTQPRDFHKLQALVYMYLLPKCESMAFFGKSYAAQVHYPDHVVSIDADEIKGAFEEQFDYWLNLVSQSEPLQRFPSEQECRFCNIGKADCHERLVEVGQSDD